MEHHPDYELWLHTNAELGQRLGSPVAERTTLHDWPLSCVQRVDLRDGRQLIYKSQFAGATVEPSFYAKARSSLLVPYQNLGDHRGTATGVLECLPVPPLKSTPITPEQAVAHMVSVAEAVRRIGDDVPVYADISTPSAWEAFAVQTLSTLADLVERGVVRRVAAETVNRLRQWVESEPVRVAVTANPGLVHGDLHAGNVFVLPDGYRAVDWQRPFRGPTGLDEIHAMQDVGLDPLAHFAAPLVAIYWFLHLAWFVQCQARFIPTCSYEKGIADRARRVLAHFM